MDYEMLENVLSDAVNDAELRTSDIPSISLYLDQIIHLISDKAHEGSQRFYGRILTKTMVNNYSKAGLISPINGKKYSSEQIIQMLMINSLKNTFSIAEIKSAMDAFYENVGEGRGLAETYDRYAQMRDNARIECTDAVRQMIEENGFDIGDDVDYLQAILGVSAMADYMNCIAHAMLEVITPQKISADGEEELAEATKVNERQIKRGAKAVKKEVKRENKAQKKAEKSGERNVRDTQEDEGSGDVLQGGDLGISYEQMKIESKLESVFDGDGGDIGDAVNGGDIGAEQNVIPTDGTGVSHSGDAADGDGAKR